MLSVTGVALLRDRCSGCPAVLGRDDDHSILSLEKEIDDDQPGPRANEEPQLATVGKNPKLGTEAREMSEWRSGRLDSRARVRGQGVGQAEAVQAEKSGLAPLELSHRLVRLAEWSRAAGSGIGDPGFDPLPGARDAVEKSEDVCRIRVSLFDRPAQ